MPDIDVAALAHSRLVFNAPLSDARAAVLVEELDLPPAGRVLDLGCGWAELLLRVVAAAPAATGLGVDSDAADLARGAAAAGRRGLTDRVEFRQADATAVRDEQADAVVCIGASHAWGGTAQALAALRPLVRPGGRLLLGDGFWQRPPTPAALAGLGAEPDELGSLADLVDTAIGHGLRPLAVLPASEDEWDVFESGWCGGLERWLLANPSGPDADRVRGTVDGHRDGWLRGYRGVLGFAYLVLAPGPG